MTQNILLKVNGKIKRLKQPGWYWAAPVGSREVFQKLCCTCQCPLSTAPLICIHAGSPSSAEAGFGSVSITGLQSLLWISCFHKLGPSPLPAYLARIGSKQNMSARVLLPCWQLCVLRFLYALDSKNSPVNWRLIPGVCVCVFVCSASTGYNVDWKHAAVLWVRDERHGSTVSGVA